MTRDNILKKAKEICAPGHHYNSPDKKLYVNCLVDGTVVVYYQNGNKIDEMMFLAIKVQYNGHGKEVKYRNEIQLCKPGYWQTALDRIKKVKKLIK